MDLVAIFAPWRLRFNSHLSFAIIPPMTDNHPITPGDAARVLRELGRDASLRRKQVVGRDLPAELAGLRQWQALRLQRTYADVLNDQRYASACRYFLTDIYAAKDFSQRDHDLENLHQLLGRFFPPQSLKLISNIVELNTLTHRLDDQLLDALVDDLGLDGSQLAFNLTPELYAAAYRVCDNQEPRAFQIELIAEVLYWVGEGAHLPLVGSTLRLAYPPAVLAGWGDFHGLVMRGYQAFKKLKSGRPFANLIYTREMRILDRIFASHPHPFALDFNEDET